MCWAKLLNLTFKFVAVVVVRASPRDPRCRLGLRNLSVVVLLHEARAQRLCEHRSRARSGHMIRMLACAVSVWRCFGSSDFEREIIQTQIISITVFVYEHMRMCTLMLGVRYSVQQKCKTPIAIAIVANLNIICTQIHGHTQTHTQRHVPLGGETTTSMNCVFVCCLRACSSSDFSSLSAQSLRPQQRRARHRVVRIDRARVVSQEAREHWRSPNAMRMNEHAHTNNKHEMWGSDSLSSTMATIQRAKRQTNCPMQMRANQSIVPQRVRRRIHATTIDHANQIAALTPSECQHF